MEEEYKTDYKKKEVVSKSEKGQIRDRYEECVKLYFDTIEKGEIMKVIKEMAEENNTTELAIHFMTQETRYTRNHNIETSPTEIFVGLLATLAATFVANLPEGVPTTIYNQLESKFVNELKKGMEVGFKRFDRKAKN